MGRYYRFRGKRRLVDAMEGLGFRAEYDLWVEGDVKRDVIMFAKVLGKAGIRIVCPAGNRNCYVDLVVPVTRKRLPSEIARLLRALESGGG